MAVDFVLEGVAQDENVTPASQLPSGQRDPDAWKQDIAADLAPPKYRVTAPPRPDDQFVLDPATERTLALQNLKQAVSEIDPRKAADALEVARKSGIDPAVVMVDPESFKRELRNTREFESLQRAPATESHLSSTENMAVGQNEIGTLAKTERLQQALAFMGASRSRSVQAHNQAMKDYLELPGATTGVGYFHAFGGGLQEGLKASARGIASYGMEGGLKLQRESRAALEGLGYTPAQVTEYLENNKALPKLSGGYAGELPWWLRSSAYRQEQGDARPSGDAEVDILNAWGLPRIIYSLGKQLEKDNKVDLDPTTFTGSMLKADDEWMRKVQAQGTSYKVVADVGQGVSSMATTLMFGLMGMPAVGLGVMGMQIAGGDMELARAEGADPDVAWRAGNWNALIQTPMEALSLAKAMKVWRPQGLLGVRFKDVFESMITEGVTEAMQSVPEKLSELYIKSNAKDITEVKGFLENVFTAEFLKESAYSGAIGALTAGIIGGPKLLHTAIFNRNRENPAHDPVTALAGQIDLMDATKSSDVAMRSFTQELINAGKLPEKVFVPAREVAALFQQEALPDKMEGVLDKMGVTPQEFADILARDGDVAIEGSRLGPILADGDSRLIANALLLNPVEREAVQRVDEIAQQMQAAGSDIVQDTETTMDADQAEKLFSTPLVENNLYREKLKADLMAAKIPAHKAEQVAALVDANAQIWSAIPGESIESYYGKFGYKIQRTNFGKLLQATYAKHGQALKVATEGEFHDRYKRDQAFRDTVHGLLEFPAEGQAQDSAQSVAHVKNPLMLGQVGDITIPAELQQAALAVTGNHENLQAITGQGVDAIKQALLGLGYDGIKFTGPDGAERMVALTPAPAVRRAREGNFQAQAAHEVVNEADIPMSEDIVFAGADLNNPAQVAEAARLWQQMGTDSPYFKWWFGDKESNLLTPEGAPMLLYHGTTKQAARKIDELKRSKIGAMGEGIYLGDSKEASAGYDQGAMLQVYARGKYLNNAQWSEYVHRIGWKEAEAAARADGWSGVYDTKYENAVVVWDSRDIKSATDNRGTFDASPRILMQSQQPAAEPFFSPTARFVDAVNVKKPQPAKFWLDQMFDKKGNAKPGLRPEELDDLGLREWLAGAEGQISKEQVLQFIKDGGPKLEEVRKGEERNLTVSEAKDILAKGGEVYAIPSSDPNSTARATLDDGVTLLPWIERNPASVTLREGTADAAHRGDINTKFSQYQLPGGENYREVLVTAPGNTFKSSHWAEPGVIAHFRLSDRTSVLDSPQVLVEAKGQKARSDSLTADAKTLSDFVESEPLSAQGQGRADVKLPAAVQASVVRAVGDAKILRGVIATVPVEVVNDLVRAKLTPEEFFSDKAVLAGSLAGGNANAPVVLSADAVRALVKSVASLVAKEVDGSAKSVGLPVQSGEAPSARDVWGAHKTSKTLFVEEIQSDLHQQGRKNGYGSQVPNAPFKKSWPMLAFKRILREAVEKGYDSVAWTTGEQQAERYDLSKQVDEIVAREKNGQYSIRANIGTGSQEIGTFTAESLPDAVGKDLAEKIVNADWTTARDDNGDPDVGLVFKGQDLKVGGEGMKGFYDKMLPKAVQDYVKKLDPNAKVGMADLDAGGGEYKVERSGSTYRLRREGSIIGTFPSSDAAWAEAERLGTTSVHSLAITPALREAITQNGQALYQAENAPKGASLFMQQHEAVIHFFESSDISTAGHEVYHVFRRVLEQMALHPNAPAWMREDWGKACEFVGATPGTRWTREQEEQFALAGEKYLTEGKAPSVELRGVFAQFRTWLLNIYKTLLNMPVKLTDEMRGVFDRMLATEQQVQMAAAKMDSAPMFEDAQIADEDRAAYVKAAREAKLAGEDEVIRKMDAQRKREMPGWRKEAEAAAAEHPGQQMLGEIVADGGLNIYELRDMGLAEADIERLRKIRPGGHLLTEGEGVKADALSEKHGFKSVTEMVSALLQAPSRQAIIDAKLAELEDAWRETWDPEVAVLSGRYEALLEMEANILAKASRGTVIKGEAIRAMVNKLTGVTSLERISTSDIENLKSALRREAAAAKRAYAAGKMEEAALAKDRQRRALAELKAKYEAKIEVAKINGQLKALLKQKGIRGEYFDQMVSLANRMGLTTRQPSDPNIRPVGEFLRDVHSAFEAEHNIDANGQPQISLDAVVARWILDDNIPTTGKMTLDQLRAAQQSLDWLAFAGRTMGKLIAKGKLVDARTVAEEFKGNVSKMSKVHRMSDREKKTFFGKITSFQRGFFADIKMMEFLVKMADGFKKGVESIHGTLRDVLIQPIMEARAAETAAWAKINERLANAVMELPKDRFVIDEVKLPEDVRVAWEGMWDWEKVFMVALNMGNKGNLKALMRGYAHTDENGDLVDWTQKDLLKITERMTPEMWDSVEEIWRVVDSVFPMVNETKLKTTGVHLKKVQAEPFQNAQGRTLRGGYYPLIFDGQFSKQAARNEERDIMNSREAVFQSPDPRSGMTIERKGGTLPPKLSISTLYKHLWDSIHYATHAEACRDAWVLINDETFQRAWTDTFGQEAYNALTPWIRYIARPEREHADQFDAFMDKLRTRSTIVILGLNMRTAVTQVGAIFNAMNDIGVANTLKGVGYMLSHRSEGWDKINEMSPFMARRGENYDLDQKRILMQRLTDAKYLDTPWGKVDMQDFHEWCFWAIKSMDGVTARAAWMGAYEKGLGEITAAGTVTDPAVAHTQAVQYADDVVRQTQGSADPMDMAAWMRDGSGLKKMFGMFMTFTMRFANRQAYYIRGLREGKVGKGEFAKHFFLEWMMPVMLTDIILAALVSGDVPDWEEKPGEFVGNMLGGFVSGIPVVRNAFAAARWAGSKITDTPALQGLDSFAKFGYETVTGIHDVLYDEVDEKQFKRWARSFVESVAYAYGIPYNWAFTAWNGVNDWIEGDTSNPLRLILKDPTRPKQRH